MPATATISFQRPSFTSSDRITPAQFNACTLTGATITLSGVLASDGTVAGTGTQQFQNLAASGTLAVTGAATLASASVTGNATVGGTLGVTGPTTLGTTNTGNLTVTGTLSTSGAATLASAGVTGNATVGGTLGVTGTTNLGATNTGNLAVTGTLTTTGQAVLESANITHSLTVSGSSNLDVVNARELSVSGSVNFGNFAATSLTTNQLTVKNGLKIGEYAAPLTGICYGYSDLTINLAADGIATYNITMNGQVDSSHIVICDIKSTTLIAYAANPTSPTGTITVYVRNKSTSTYSGTVKVNVLAVK